MEKLELLFSKQKPLIDYFAVIKEGLPEPPINLQSKKGQLIIKSFIDRAIEELAEAHEQYGLAWDYVDVNQMSKSMKPTRNFLEELADVAHFIIEAMIYAGITPRYIKKVTDDISGGLGLSDSEPMEVMDYLEALLDHNIYCWNNDDIIMDPAAFAVNGVSLSYIRFKVQKSLFWDLTCSLKLSANLLKKKEWREDTKDLEISKFKEMMIRGFISFLSILHTMGISSDKLVEIYTLKNNINLERIEKDKALK